MQQRCHDYSLQDKDSYEVPAAKSKNIVERHKLHNMLEGLMVAYLDVPEDHSNC